MDPKIPPVFAQWLGLLPTPDAEAMYEMAVGAAPSNYVTLAIQDITQSQGNDDYGVKPAPAPQAEIDLQYATRLAMVMAKNFYPDVQFTPLEDIYGVLSQIDNMMTGIARTQAKEPQP